MRYGEDLADFTQEGELRRKCPGMHVYGVFSAKRC